MLFSLCKKVRIRKISLSLVICVLIGLIGTTFMPMNVDGSVDILTPSERDWLNKNQSRIILAIESGYAPFIFLDSHGQVLL